MCVGGMLFRASGVIYCERKQERCQLHRLHERIKGARTTSTSCKNGDCHSNNNTTAGTSSRTVHVDGLNGLDADVLLCGLSGGEEVGGDSSEGIHGYDGEGVDERLWKGLSGELVLSALVRLPCLCWNLRRKLVKPSTSAPLIRHGGRWAELISQVEAKYGKSEHPLLQFYLRMYSSSDMCLMNS
ncbi:uncharacterized protein EI90DRAFT_1799905 [Cantharellus anzutake]|uniref:uncharacterized protein n=1 Tax=Cantharellus anzutake TaxID=1750568 RepID=UPI001906506D|nr:uncharacterized protein EI90DRAFT_1799905 [Cantharellus anzutake]KAF8327481.1 hypothetical protein EI90DRAFT_1799905 [Cantharellus anzutake]